MAGEQRKDDRVPVNLRVRLQFADLDAFVAGFARNLSRDGMFLEDVASRAPGTLLRFELVLGDGSAALRGEGRVIWSRASGAGRGVAVRFTLLDARSKALLDSLSTHAQIRTGSIPPPLPRSVAPKPVRAVDLTAVLRDLEGLEQEVISQGVHVGVSRAPRRSLRDLAADLDALQQEAPRVVARLPSRRPPFPSDSDLPPVLGLIQSDGDLRVVEVHAPVASHVPPPLPDPTRRRTTVPPEAMREPLADLALEPEALDTTPPPADEFAPMPAIPHPPRMPGADVSPRWTDADPLPDLELETMMEEPDVEADPSEDDPAS